MNEAAPALLEIRDLNAWYGESHILHGMNFNVADGEVVTLLGRNGAGKSTTLKAIMGMVPRIKGSVRKAGEELVGLAPHTIAATGIGYCPEERGIFAGLSVTENLELPPVVAPDPFSIERIYQMFPNLYERRATSQGTKLSGGEQQMLAIARILRTGARFLLLDEPTEGLAPTIVQQIGRAINELKKTGMTIVLVEQNFRFASRVADRHHVIEGGRVIDIMTNDELRRNEAKLRSYLGV